MNDRTTTGSFVARVLWLSRTEKHKLCCCCCFCQPIHLADCTEYIQAY